MAIVTIARQLVFPPYVTVGKGLMASCHSSHRAYILIQSWSQREPEIKVLHGLVTISWTLLLLETRLNVWVWFVCCFFFLNHFLVFDPAMQVLEIALQRLDSLLSFGNYLLLGRVSVIFCPRSILHLLFIKVNTNSKPLYLIFTNCWLQIRDIKIEISHLNKEAWSTFSHMWKQKTHKACKTNNCCFSSLCN